MTLRTTTSNVDYRHALPAVRHAHDVGSRAARVVLPEVQDDHPTSPQRPESTRPHQLATSAHNPLQHHTLRQTRRTRRPKPHSCEPASSPPARINSPQTSTKGTTVPSYTPEEPHRLQQGSQKYLPRQGLE